jgi:ElaB/YqjD/DUF883 family membrane-anchored ribosome-binding protein
MSILDSAAALTSRTEHDLRSELKSLRKEVSHLSRSLSDMGHSVYRDVRGDTEDAFKQFRRTGRKAAKVVRRQTHEAVDIAQEHPLATAAALAGIGLLIAAVIAWEWESN